MNITNWLYIYEYLREQAIFVYKYVLVTKEFL